MWLQFLAQILPLLSDEQKTQHTMGLWPNQSSCCPKAECFNIFEQFARNRSAQLIHMDQQADVLLAYRSIWVKCRLNHEQKSLMACGYPIIKTIANDVHADVCEITFYLFVNRCHVRVSETFCAVWSLLWTASHSNRTEVEPLWS